MFTEIVYETLTKFIRYTLFSSSSSSRGISIVAFLIPSVFHNLLFQFVFKIRIAIYISIYYYGQSFRTIRNSSTFFFFVLITLKEDEYSNYIVRTR